MCGLVLIIAVFIIVILIIGFHQKATNAICLSRKRLEGKTVLVTGGTTGIGLEIAMDLAHRGARVIVACPFKEEGENSVKQVIEETENESVVYKLLDLSSLDSIKKFAEDILTTEDRLDILINNAGVGVPCDSLTKDGMHFIMQVNYYGTFLLTLLLLPLLIKTGNTDEPSRIIMTSSVLHKLGQVDFKNLNRLKYWFRIQIYANSKLCLTMFGIELAKRLKEMKIANVIVNCVDPGAVGTRIFYSENKVIGFFLTNLMNILFKTTWYGAQTSLFCALDKKSSKVSGAYFQNCQLGKAKKCAYCDKTCKLLWSESMKLIGLNSNELEQCFKSL